MIDFSSSSTLIANKKSCVVAGSTISSYSKAKPSRHKVIHSDNISDEEHNICLEIQPKNLTPSFSCHSSKKPSLGGIGPKIRISSFLTGKKESCFAISNEEDSELLATPRYCDSSSSASFDSNSPGPPLFRKLSTQRKDSICLRKGTLLKSKSPIQDCEILEETNPCSINRLKSYNEPVRGILKKDDLYQNQSTKTVQFYRKVKVFVYAAEGPPNTIRVGSCDPQNNKQR